MKWIRGILTVGTFAVLYYYENKRPLRKQVEPKEINTARNFAIASLAGVTSALLENPVAEKLTKFTEQKRFGLLKIFRLPKFVEDFLAVLLLDYTLYVWHVLTHKSDFLWNFHKIHHADLDLTASTAIRFHFGEIAISVIWRAGQILFIGVSPEAFKIWQTGLLMSIFFHHSNVEIPQNIEKHLQKIIATPRLPGIHHSEVKAAVASNWSSGLSVWDFLHGTFRDDIPQSKIRIGIREFEDEQDISLKNMLVEPMLIDINGNKKFTR
ncbi:MAG: sterol desaturase family protein [Aridibacter sp.]